MCLGSLNNMMQDTVGELYQRARELLNLGSEQIRIWDYYGKIKQSLMNDPKQTLEDADIQMDHEVLLEVQVDGSWPDEGQKCSLESNSKENELALVPVAPVRSSFSVDGGPSGNRNITRSSSPDNFLSNTLNSSYDDREGGAGYFAGGVVKSVPLGLTGLQNLGNTCFMNSALQCLVHTPELVDFFLNDYTHEINTNNPLGMEGELAMAFGELLRKLWEPGRQPFAPRGFKVRLARFAPQFSGYNQHDSQELLAFLLDGLHEDLNRVKLKPYVESKDEDDRPDEELARENWENHKARNDSIIVDICQGQYKSTLVCPVCSKVSITFDPFMYLSLPLPSTLTRTLSVKLFSTDGATAPMTYTVTVAKQSRCKDVILALSKACSLGEDERILLTEPFSILDGPSLVREEDSLTAHRLPKSSEKAPLLIFVNKRTEEDSLPKKPVRYLGSPLITWVPEENFRTGADLYHVFERILQPLRKTPTVSSVNVEDAKHEENGLCNHLSEDGEMGINDNDIPNVNASVEGNPQVKAFGVCNHFLKDQKLFQFYAGEERFGAKVLVEMNKELPDIFSRARSNAHIYVEVNWPQQALEEYDVKQLETAVEGMRTGFALKKQRQEAVSLYSCLEAFLKEEPLGPEDMWYCPSCKEHRQASKKLDLWRLPDILVVHLKRFSYSRYLKNKLDTFVEFPVHDLDLCKYIPQNDKAVYDLYAISNHYGSMGGGHYTAYVKLLEENRWYSFDDSHVSPVSETDIMTPAAYVLFYCRVRNENSNGYLNHGSCQNRVRN
ncbi:hypothetical protein KP509_27G028200 [Ceratopteris richardii]|uniref:Ubiquitin carboxyl-terminal hydrolase n=1 Tax=Ceratopteris richardii TaxID=49495 RepID=A0A8T2RHF1_CERRI|nr:hypothetical protein KP509_27G028200 [Ceratopteris richardii]